MFMSSIFLCDVPNKVKTHSINIFRVSGEASSSKPGNDSAGDLVMYSLRK